jgi:electron transport complex protein RnfE
MSPPTDDGITTSTCREHDALGLLAILPVLAGATSAGTALALGAATVVVLAVTLAAIALLGPATSAGARLLLGTIVSGALVTCLDLAARAFLPDLYAALGPFVLLIAPATLVFAHLFSTAPGRAVAGSFAMGLATLGVFVALGTLRELVGRATLLADTALLANLDGTTWRITLPGGGIPAAAFLPGALLTLAALLALHRRRTMERPR